MKALRYLPAATITASLGVAALITHDLTTYGVRAEAIAPVALSILANGLFLARGVRPTPDVILACPADGCGAAITAAGATSRDLARLTSIITDHAKHSTAYRKATPMTCEFCNEAKPDVSVRRDPFAWEVNDEDWQVPMCADCEQIRADDA